AAVILAVEAGAVEGALRSSGATVGMSTYAIVAALGGAAIIASRPTWGSPIQRALATYGGMVVVFLAALVSVLAPLSARHVDGVALAAIGTSATVCAAIAAWRPAWGAIVLTGTVTIGAVTAASMWGLTAGQLTVTFALAALLVVVGLGRVRQGWRAPGLWGLLPGLAATALVMLVPALDGVPGALTGLELAREYSVAGIGGLSWFGLALVLIAALPLLTARWHPRVFVSAAWAQYAAAIAFAAGTVFIALDGAEVTAGGAAAAGLGLATAAGVQWLAAPLWGAKRVVPARALAIGLVTIGGLHGAGAVVESNDSRAQLLWGSVAIIVAIVALAAAAVRQRHAAAQWSLVAVVGAGAWTWHASQSLGAVAVAAALAALLVAAVATRLPSDYVSLLLTGSLPAYVAAGVGVAAGTINAGIHSFGWHEAGTVVGFEWAVVLSACVAVAGPVMASLGDRVGLDSPLRVTRVVTGIGLLALALTVLARAQQLLADAGAVQLTIADAGAPALAVGVGGLAYGLVAAVRWWRPARRFVGIGSVSLVSVHGLVGLGRLSADAVDLWWTVGAVLLAAAALGVTAAWFPGVALAPSVFLASLVAPAALAPDHGELALAVAAVAAGAVAWIARLRSGLVRAATLLGGIGVLLVAAMAGLLAMGVAFMALAQTWAGDDVAWRQWLMVAVAAITIGMLAWTPARKVAGGVVAVALATMAGLVPGPVGWLALATTGALSTEAAARWRSRLGLHPLVPLALGLASVAWAFEAEWATAVALGAVSLASIWTAIRAADGGTRTSALVLAPVAGATAVFLALDSWNVDWGVAATIAAGTAFAMPLVAVAAGLDSRRLVAVSLLGFTSLFGPPFTADLGLAGLVVVLACAAWFALSTMGVGWARWVALGGLSVAAMALAADVGLATLEAYTAVPALTMIAVGLWWLRRDARIRTYVALAPGLGAALVPSYLALAIHPEVFSRTLALVGAALMLALVGVALRWFAPLVATAVTTVVVALSQATASESLLPLWLSVSIIGAVLFALAILAERIKAMR
ncbi:MAG: hypothetical protein HGA51_03285, partial [Demequinaceae bacterium]|nr:hypothetical protein [Demequinaceae bacterium]